MSTPHGSRTVVEHHVVAAPQRWVRRVAMFEHHGIGQRVQRRRCRSSTRRPVRSRSNGATRPRRVVRRPDPGRGRQRRQRRRISSDHDPWRRRRRRRHHRVRSRMGRHHRRGVRHRPRWDQPDDGRPEHGLPGRCRPPGWRAARWQHQWPDLRSRGFTSVGAVNTTASTSFTIDGEGHPDAVFIFQVGGALALGANITMNLTGGARAENVYWAVTGAGVSVPTSSFVGTLIATTAVTSGAGSTINGRLTLPRRRDHDGEHPDLLVASDRRHRRW